MDFKLRKLLKLLILYILEYFSGFLNERLIFYELFCEGPSALRKYALTAVRGGCFGYILSVKLLVRALLCYG